MSHAATADGLLIKPADCPAGTACSPGQIPGKTLEEVSQVSSHKKADTTSLTARHDGGKPHSPSQVFFVPPAASAGELRPPSPQA